MKPLPFPLPAYLTLADKNGEKPTKISKVFQSVPSEISENAIFEELVDYFKKELTIADRLIVADCGMSVREQRALLLACDECPGERSFIPCVAIDEDGMTTDGWECAAALVMLQNMGAAAMLLVPQNIEAEDEIPGVVDKLSEDKKIPIGLVLNDDNKAKLMKLCPCVKLYFFPMLQDALQEDFEFSANSEKEIPEREEFVAVSNGETHLLDATFDVDGEISEFDEFTDKLLELEQDGCNALRIDITDEYELEIFEREEYMIKNALCISAVNETIFEKALRAFCGRAMYDSTEPMEDEFLMRMSKKYGLILL